MALCVTASNNGTLSSAGPLDSSCSTYALVGADELDTLNILTNVFSTPDTISIQQAFMAGISIPIICYLTAFGYQTVISFISKREY